MDYYIEEGHWWLYHVHTWSRYPFISPYLCLFIISNSLYNPFFHERLPFHNTLPHKGRPLPNFISLQKICQREVFFLENLTWEGFGCCKSLQHCLASMAKLNLLRSLNPSPPSFFALSIWFQDTYWILPSLVFYPNQIFFKNNFSLLVMDIGRRKVSII